VTARLISSATLWHLHVAQGRVEALCDWARANGIEPGEVSADDDITIEDGPDGWVIRYRAFVRSSSGSKQVDPIRSEEALTEARIVPLVAEPPEDWPVYAVPGPA
jgi:hypothetical protein